MNGQHLFHLWACMLIQLSILCQIYYQPSWVLYYVDLTLQPVGYGSPWSYYLLWMPILVIIFHFFHPLKLMTITIWNSTNVLVFWEFWITCMVQIHSFELVKLTKGITCFCLQHRWENRFLMTTKWVVKNWNKSDSWHDSIPNILNMYLFHMNK